MGEETREITAPKILLFIAMLFIFQEAIAYFYAAGADAMFILYGIIGLVFVFIIFISLDLVSLGPVKLTYWWWLMVIIGVILIIFNFLAGGTYFTPILVLLAVIVELVTEKKDITASKIILLFGIAFGIWDCVAIFIGYTAGAEIFLVNAIFGLILAIILLILVLDLVDIKIPFTWWVVLIIAFVLFYWITPGAIILSTYPVVGFGGIVLMIGWLLLLIAL
ncbi:MAG: hypothetical protein ACW98X_19230 [Promethearchaeota archaeon]|jgi:hypothetical protein